MKFCKHSSGVLVCKLDIELGIMAYKWNLFINAPNGDKQVIHRKKRIGQSTEVCGTLYS